MKKQLLFLVMLLTPMMASADDSGSCGNDVTFYYEETTHKLTISGTGMMTNYGRFNYYNIGSASWNNDPKPWDSYISDIQIVEIGEGVTSIGSFSFKDCKNLTTVTMPNSVTTIGQGAFWGCKYLYSLTISSGLTSVGLGAFMECSSLVSIKLPDHLASIGNYAFKDCMSLTSVKVPTSLTSIGADVFYNCKSLISLHISDLTAWCNMNFTGNLLPIAYRLYLNGKEIKDLVIPEGVTAIGNYVFYGCSGLTSVTIPNSLTSIGSNAFGECSGLTSIHISDIVAWCNIQFKSNPLSNAQHLYLNGVEVKDLVIPSNVISISERAFYQCTNLTSVIIEDGVTSISNSAFWGCSSISSVMIPNSVNSIGEWAFAECGSLSSITIPSSVNSIGRYAFYLCKSLTSVTIPDNLTSINDGVFYGCSGLPSVTIPNSVTSIGEGAFGDCGCLKSLRLSENLKILKNGSFNGCNSLESITIPSLVEIIYQNAFAKCNNLKQVNALPDTPPILYDNSFSNYDITLCVSDASKEAYMNTSPWNKFTNIKTLTGSDMEKQKCATPTIAYQNGELMFSCETEDVEYVYDVKMNDTKAGRGDKVKLTPTYIISVYATKANYETSDVATITIDLLSQSDNGMIGDLNNDGKINAADVVKLVNIIASQ